MVEQRHRGVIGVEKSITALGLTQRAAARRRRTTPPELSKILRGKFSEVSLERLMRFLAALGHRIEIRVGTAGGDEAGEVVVGNLRRRAA